jgi:solute carrier family 39 (zinc transporter), member 7
MRETMTQYMISFAIGGLLGDVFFHTLPHMNAGGAHSHSDHGHHNHGDHSHNPEEMKNNFIVIIGIIAFFLMEKLTTTYLGGGHNHDHGSSSQTHEHSKVKG